MIDVTALNTQHRVLGRDAALALIEHRDVAVAREALRQVQDSVPESPWKAAFLDTLNNWLDHRPARCGATSGGDVCDRLVGHDGPHGAAHAGGRSSWRSQ